MGWCAGIQTAPDSGSWTVLDATNGVVEAGFGTDVLTGLSNATYSVVWNPLATYATPSDAVAQVADGQVAAVSGTYTKDSGTLNVATTPIPAGWTVSSHSGYSHTGTGSASLDLPVDEYRIQWDAVEGYELPFSTYVSITNQGHVQSVTGAYVEVVATTNEVRLGTLSVSSTPSNGVWTIQCVDGFEFSGFVSRRQLSVNGYRLSVNALSKNVFP